jgi:NTP pyrophosphatase (non-canonical NTP hydrolase)
MLTLNEYQTQASGTAVYPGRMSPHGLMYCALKLNGEAGELAEHVNNRKFSFSLDANEEALIAKEIGDVAWYCAALCDELGCTLFFAVGYELTQGHIGTKEPIEQLALRLNAEAGKLAEHVGKAMRDDGYGMPESFVPGALRVGEPGNGNSTSDTLTTDRRSKIIYQIRQIMICLDDLSDRIYKNMPNILDKNLKKLADRKARGVLGGSGDNR